MLHAMMPRNAMDMVGTCHGYGRGMDFTYKK